MTARCALGLAVSFAVGCGSGAAGTPAPPTSAVAAPSSALAPPSSAVAAPSVAPVAPAHVDVLWLTELYFPGLTEPTDAVPTMGTVAITPTPAGSVPEPATEPLGELFEHEGHYHLDAIRDVPAPYPSITVVGRDGTCEAPVRRAVDARAIFLDGTDDDSIAESHRVLFVGACEGAGIASNAIGGAAVRWRALDMEAASPAPADVTAAVRARFTDAPSTITALPLAATATAQSAFVAYDGSVWYAVRDGAVRWTLPLAPLAEIVAGDRVFVLGSTSEDDALRAVDDADPPQPADAPGQGPIEPEGADAVDRPAGS